MQERKTRVVLDIWIARLGSVFGWIFLVFWTMMGAVGLAELGSAEDATHRVMPFVCLGLAALHYLLIRAMRKTKDLVGDFRLYSSVLAQDPDKLNALKPNCLQRAAHYSASNVIHILTREMDGETHNEREAVKA